MHDITSFDVYDEIQKEEEKNSVKRNVKFVAPSQN